MQLELVLEKLGFSAPQVEDISRKFTLDTFEPGQHVCREGDDSGYFYLVESGELLVSRLQPSGQPRTLAMLAPGDPFGEVGVLQGIARTATVTALTHVRLYQVDKAGFDELLASSDAFGDFLDRLHLMRSLANLPLFGGLDSAALEKLLSIVEIRELSDREALCDAGDTVKHLDLLLEGRLSADGGAGAEPLSTGAAIGENGLLSTGRHHRGIRADGPARVARIRRDRFLGLVRRTPSIALKLRGLGFVKALVPLFFDKSALLFLPDLAMNNPNKTMRVMVLFLLAILVPALLPNLSPQTFPFLSPLSVDTNPENMLAADEPVRVFHKSMRKRMNLHDMIVLGVVNDSHPQGVFNARSLGDVHALTEFAMSLRWPDPEDPERQVGVIPSEVLAPSTVDVMHQGQPGTIHFEWLMGSPPADDAEAAEVLRQIKRFPMMSGIFASDDGQALAIYLPITSKEVSWRVYNALRDRIDTFDGDDRYHITGLPVAEDVFGVEMFIQMAVAAPMAMVVIFLLMLYFFRSLTLVLSPMIVAMVSVMSTMGLLIVSGNTVHIMSSMIAIFVMPIAVLDSVHILSEFFDAYPRIRDRRLTLNYVMRELFMPMMFTSITTAIGFLSLALVPIPPVQVFGVFVAIGVSIAWVLSITVVPAYICLMSDSTLERMAEASRRAQRGSGNRRPLFRVFHAITSRRPLPVVLLVVGCTALCLYGVTRIVVNDNPIRWFGADHDIRVADRVLNEHMGGTYMAYLSLAPTAAAERAAVERIRGEIGGLVEEFQAAAGSDAPRFDDFLALLDGDARLAELRQRLLAYAEDRLDNGPDDQQDLWYDVLADVETVEGVSFKDPALLGYVSDLQRHVGELAVVGKSISLADFSKTVYRELRSGKDEDYVLPSSSQGIAQTLITYQNSHRPDDLWHSVTPDYGTGVIWFLLKSGDNQDMLAVAQRAEDYMRDNPPPAAVDAEWFGLTWVNVIWQDKMVNGMMYSIAGSFLAVWLLMILLLRSWLWGILAMIPLTATMMIIYGVLGLVGKPYDMPVAVLSSLSIGLAVDFTIHYLVRIRHVMSQVRDAGKALQQMFGEPALAIWRNMLVVAIGFLPLLLSPLIPYNTVGILIAIILSVSGVATLLVLPSVLNLGRRRLFPGVDSRRTTVFGPVDGIVAGLVAALLIGFNIEALSGHRPGALVWAGLLILLPLAMYARQRRP